jgi:hypothetical protein
MTLDATTSQALSSMDLVNLVQTCRKQLPAPEKDNFQGFPNKKISKFEILNTVYAMRKSENVNTDNTEEGLQSDLGELGFQHIMDRHCEC